MTTDNLSKKDNLQEAFLLSESIIKNIELSELSLTDIALKTSRLARLLNDLDYHKIMRFEAGGYPNEIDGISPEPWRLTEIAKRRVTEKDAKTGEVKEFAYLTSISELEENIKIAQISLESARDPDVSISSANPNQFVWGPQGNYIERNSIRIQVSQSIKRLASRREFVYSYALQKYYELKFSGLADDIFSRIRERVDKSIGEIIPEELERFSSIYNNLISENPEDWSNSVHSCRRMLQNLADRLFPPAPDKEIDEKGKKKTIKLGPDNYINRLIAYIETKSSSERFIDIVGSHLRFIGDRLESIFLATQKGSHSLITKEEADRYVVYTYLFLGDILSL
jgi:hypothetical protein